MLKKWKRWKLGKDIDEEYRHTHSQTPHIKSGSSATGNLPDLLDNNTSDPSGGSMGTLQHKKADRGSSNSTAPDENHQLVMSYSDEMGKVNKNAFHLSFLSQRGLASTTSEDVCLEERAQCHSYPTEGAETDVWVFCECALWSKTVAFNQWTSLKELWVSELWGKKKQQHFCGSNWWRLNPTQVMYCEVWRCSCLCTFNGDASVVCVSLVQWMHICGTVLYNITLSAFNALKKKVKNYVWI